MTGVGRRFGPVPPMAGRITIVAPVRLLSADLATHCFESDIFTIFRVISDMMSDKLWDLIL
jgi:hypothetical protein